MKLLCLLTMVSYIITATIIESGVIIGWLKKDKLKYDPDRKRCYVITTSTDYINKKQGVTLYKFLKEAKVSNDLDYVLVVVDSIQQQGKNPAYTFSNDLHYLMADAGFIDYYSSVVMVFAMVDQLFSIKRGPTAELQFSDTRVDHFLNEITSDFMKKDYYTAFLTLIKHFTEKPESSSGSNSAIIISIIIGVCVIIAIIIIIIGVKKCRTSQSINYEHPNSPLYSKGGKAREGNA